MASLFFNPQGTLHRTAERMHYRLFDGAEAFTRLHMNTAGDWLDLNRKGLDALYGSESFKESYYAQKDLISEAGSLLSRYAKDMRDFSRNLGGSSLLGNME